MAVEITTNKFRGGIFRPKRSVGSETVQVTDKPWEAILHYQQGGGERRGVAHVSVTNEPDGPRVVGKSVWFGEVTRDSVDSGITRSPLLPVVLFDYSGDQIRDLEFTTGGFFGTRDTVRITNEADQPGEVAA